MRNLWFKQSLKEAVDAPRIHHQLHPNEIGYEYGNLKVLYLKKKTLKIFKIKKKVDLILFYLQQEIEGLEKLGHKTDRYMGRGSIVCALIKNETAIYANADHRKGGDVFGLD